MRVNFRHIIFVVFLLICLPIASQTVESLKKERTEIEARLKETDRLLKKTQKEEKSTLNRINILLRTLNDRKKLINNFNSEIALLDSSLVRLAKEQKEMERQLADQKNEYARMVRKMQSTRSNYSPLMFVLSAKTFDQSVRRARYLGQFTDYRKAQVRKIEGLQRSIQEKADSLERNKQVKLQSLELKKSEAEKLQSDERKERSLYAGLKKEERNLLNQYKVHEKKRAQIDRKIQQMIEEEIRKAEERRRLAEERRKAEEAARKAAEEKRLAEQRAREKKTETARVEDVKPVEKTTPVSTPKPVASVDVERKQEQLAGSNFAANKGRLPWPVDRGVIHGHFGKQPHPELRYVEVNNKGTYFRSPAGTDARSVYDGVVAKVFSLPGSGSAVIVQHGNYRTVYANLSAVYVREGEQLKVGQKVGKIFMDDSSGQAELQFQIYSDRNLINPEAWIKR